MAKKLTQEEVIKRFNKTHGVEKYDYKDVIYINTRTKIKITCNTCGKSFKQSAKNHLCGYGCPYCGDSRMTQEEFEQKSIKKWGSNLFDLSKAVYINNREKIKLGCKICGNWYLQVAGSHLAGHGCPYCSNAKRKQKITHNNEIFAKKGSEIHPGLFYYGNVQYINSHTKVEIICLTCGEKFWQTPSDHLHGYGCPHCNFSKKEKHISDWLKNNNIKFEAQKRFEDCKDKKPLPFDFYLPDYNMCIEYQGEQHYKPRFFIKMCGKEFGIKRFEILQKHDWIKKNYCKNNGIFLLEIKSKENIAKRLEEKIRELKQKTSNQ